jgi:hypothetical protein
LGSYIRWNQKLDQLLKNVKKKKDLL